MGLGGCPGFESRGGTQKKYVVIVSAGSIQPREKNEKFILNDLWGHYNKKKKNIISLLGLGNVAIPISPTTNL